MATVSVAGGTGGLGRTIVDELVRQGKYKVLIFSRRASTIPKLKTVPVLHADYSNPAAMKKLLQEHSVDVVISALSLFDEDSAKAQMVLINAAIESGTVKRFVPSEFGVDYTQPGLADAHPGARWFNDAADMLRESKLEFTRVIFGQLTDHYGYPHCQSYMKQFTYFMDFVNRKAAVPGDGEASATFLHSADVAKYTVALLDEDKWPQFSAFASDRLTWNELVRLAEKVTGAKWDVTHDSLGQLRKGEVTFLQQPTGAGSYNMPEDAGRQMAAEFGIMAAEGIMDVSPVGLRNGEFPDVEPITVEKLIAQAWGKKN
ncbi:NAD(P)-binding protein [Karstenula rhodostoma CBS 690.94]|uniref:NAD(P)-binding protein n=1 Tax=Karstenula rhodostoma CBS 690.94 TaxID=1392251 RepID=A0A9P4Q0D7_9PLEO|nr:NAD(P)-binding protein [Karstenula rhodostoma CBS 690.94]